MNAEDIQALRDMCSAFENLLKRHSAMTAAMLDIKNYTAGDADTLRRLAQLALTNEIELGNG